MGNKCCEIPAEELNDNSDFENCADVLLSPNSDTEPWNKPELADTTLMGGPDDHSNVREAEGHMTQL